MARAPARARAVEGRRLHRCRYRGRYRFRHTRGVRGCDEEWEGGEGVKGDSVLFPFRSDWCGVVWCGVVWSLRGVGVWASLKGEGRWPPRGRRRETWDGRGVGEVGVVVWCLAWREIVSFLGAWDDREGCAAVGLRL